MWERVFLEILTAIVVVGVIIEVIRLRHTL